MMINENSKQSPTCQLGQIENMHQPLGKLEGLWQLRNRVKRIVKRRLRFLTNITQPRKDDSATPAVSIVNVRCEPLQPGDWVRVRRREEIQATLGKWNSFKGCSFMEEMWDYCGTNQRVFKRIERFLDERDYHTKKVHGVVILDHVICQGTVDFGPCDRSCFFFWHEEWLEKINE